MITDLGCECVVGRGEAGHAGHFAPQKDVNETFCFEVNSEGTREMSVGSLQAAPVGRKLPWKQIRIVQEPAVAPRAAFASASERLPFWMCRKEQAW